MSAGRMTRVPRVRARRPRPGVPRALRVTRLTSTSVSLTWKTPKAGEPPAGYEVLRGGRRLARVHGRAHVDHAVSAGQRYLYTVRAFDRHGHLGPATAALTVVVPSAGTARDTRPPSVPRGLRGTAATEASLSLTWDAASDNVGVAAYGIYRDGALLTAVTGTAFTDSALAAGTNYAYAVDAVDAAGNRSARSAPTTLRTAAGTGAVATGPAPAAPSGPTTTATTTSVTPAATPLTQAMVDRMFWRAGFGPSQADRDRWINSTQAELVDWMLSQTQSYPPATVPPTHGGAPIDPTNGNQFDFLMEWLNRMQTGVNPLTERLTFFWHRHFAVASSAGIPNAWLLTYRNRLQRYGDLAANPTASFRDLAREMTTQDGAMSYFLTGDENVVGHANENYGREFMELFSLGVLDGAGNPNYTQDNVEQVARAFTGWQLDQDPDSATYGQVSFAPDLHDGGEKTIFGQTGTFGADDAVDLILARPAHAPFLLTKLWNEFITAPIPPDTLADLVGTYTAGGALALAPVMRKILNHALIFESLDEPNMVKPPVVFYIGLIRAMDAPLQDYWPYVILQNCQQLPYDPPNVAGWEGGLSWLNTSTIAARFDAAISSQYLKYGPPGNDYIDQGGDGETAQEAYDRAYAAALQPWLAAGTRELLLDFSAATPSDSDDARRERQYALRAFMLAGPDAQVM